MARAQPIGGTLFRVSSGQVARTPDCRADGGLLATMDSAIPARFFHPATKHTVRELTRLLWSVLWTSNCSADTQLHIALQDVAQHDLPSAPPFGLVFPEEQLENAFRVSQLSLRLGGLIRLALIMIAFLLTRSASSLFCESATPIPSIAVTATLTGFLISICALTIVIGKLLIQHEIAQGSVMANTGIGLLTASYYVRQAWVVVAFTHNPTPPAVVTWVTLASHTWGVPTMLAAMFSVSFYMNTFGSALVVTLLATSPHSDEAVRLQLAIGSFGMGAILYTIERNARTSFLHQLEGIKGQLLQSKLQAREVTQAGHAFAICLLCMAESIVLSAFHPINHAAKRTMVNSLFWARRIPHLTEPSEMIKVASEIEHSNSEGISLCQSALLRSQIAIGEYRVSSQQCEFRDMLASTFDNNPRINSIMVDPACPAFVELDKLLYTELIQTMFDQLTIVSDGSNFDLVVAVSQKAQCERSVQMLAARLCRLSDVQTESNPHEILTQSCAVEEMAKLLDADVDLGSSNFQDEFVLSIPLIVSERPTEMCLKEGTICIAADDDKVMRMGYKMLYKKLKNLDINNSTFDEACTVADRVLKLAGQYGEDKILVILDQNLDGYPEGRVYGTGITKELRDSGFGGPIFIRSANDDIDAVSKYIRAGATGSLSKSGRMQELVANLIEQLYVCNYL